MDHSKPEKLGGAFRGAKGREGEIVDLGNGSDKETDPLFQFRSGALLELNQMKIL